MQRIVLIGPVYPYKGGISHYTSLLYRALVKKYDVEMISYKVQYPKWLFKKEQKDFSNNLFQIKDTKFWIHTANPFNIIRVGQKIKNETGYGHYAMVASVFCAVLLVIGKNVWWEIKEGFHLS